ncbi:hypothetical protein FACS189445_4120 [Spirochaetia bacterium]|nr:hypothetical protein FACS189445_4120 [Spirochaetia bacterium]
MEKSIWNNLNTIKERVAQYTRIANENDWISEKECTEIIEKLNNDSLTIGVIGQMKCGKSTFLNAFLFQDTILPASSTPMTAALSFITYGEKKEIKIEFHSSDEWKEIRNLATIEDEGSKFEAARELVKKAERNKLQSEINSLLGSEKTDSFENLETYVGADGKYTPITKAVTIFYPDERLKGVHVVDTPGFNDPVKSREDRTEEFLSRADVVILLLYAGRSFDKTDHEILFDKVKNVGPGKILIGVNKFDVEVKEGKADESIRNYAIEEIKKDVRAKNDPVLNQLLNDPNPILLSANMALLGLMPLGMVLSDETLSYDYKRLLKIFEITQQSDLVKKSRIGELEREIDIILTKTKVEILVRKPVHTIQAKIDAKKTGYSLLANTLSIKKKDLSLSEDELQEKLKKYQRAHKRIDRIITAKGLDLDEFVDGITKRMLSNLRSERKNSIDQLHRIIDTEKNKTIESKMRGVFRQLNQHIETIALLMHNDIRTNFEKIAEETIIELEEIIFSFSDDDDDEKSKDYIIKCRKELRNFNEFSVGDLFPQAEFKKFREWWHFRDTKKGWIDDLLPENEIANLTANIKNKAKEFIDFFRNHFLEDLLGPIIENIERVQQAGFDREAELKEINRQMEKNTTDMKKIDEQLEDINEYIQNLPL